MLLQAISVGTRADALLARAREAARRGELVEALGQYAALFGAAPPPGHLALELYEACVGVPAQWERGRRGLEDLARRVPSEQRYALALARALTYRAETRETGVSRLEALADDPRIAALAGAALRNALLWLPPSQSSLGHLDRWLARHPGDEDVARARDGMAQGAALDSGWRALAAGRVSDAERDFGTAGASDARARAGLAVAAIRRRDWARALALAEASRDLAPGEPEIWEAPLHDAEFWQAMADGRMSIRAHQWDVARTRLDDAARMPVPQRWQADVALAELDEQRGDLDAAAARLQTLLEARPREQQALRGLVRILSRAGRGDEAVSLADRLSGLAQPATGDRALRAEALRTRAAARRERGDLDGARADLLRARASDPTAPWVLHDLAATELDRRDVAAAGRAATDLLRLAPGLDAARVVNARVLAAKGRRAESLRMLEAIPAGSRTPNAEVLRTQLAFDLALEVAVESGATRDVLRRIRRNTSGHPDRLAAVARALARAGDTAAAAAAMHEAASAPDAPASVRVELAAMLLATGRDDAEVRLLLEDLAKRGELTPDEHKAVNGMLIGLAVRRADSLRERGDVDGAYRALQPRLERDPEDPRVLAALGRVFHARGDPDGARAAFRRALENDPDSIEARQGAFAAAVALGDLGDARRLVADARRRRPGSAQAHVLAARDAELSGDDFRALSELRAALALARADSAPVGGGRPADPLLTRAAAAIAGPDAPIVNVEAEIRRDIARIEARRSPRLDAAFEVRERGGESGLSRLTAFRQPLRAALPLGRSAEAWLRVAPVELDPGVLPLDRPWVSDRFGAGLPGTGGVETGAAGVELGAGIARGALSADVGTTPIGFTFQSVVWELRGERASGPLSLSASLSRAGVTDSVVSWAGVRDPGSGEAFGGVVRTEARVEASWSRGAEVRRAFAAANLLTGTGVMENRALIGGAMAQWPLARFGPATVRAGLSILAAGYERNLSRFTLGHGGYFSPQEFVHSGVPLHVETGGGVRWSLDIEPGMNWLREASAPVFPLRPSAGGEYPDRSGAGLAFDVRGAARFRLGFGLDTALHVEAHQARDYREILASVAVSWLPRVSMR
jgi:tetratricopeptide (TPR) repeat protein